MDEARIRQILTDTKVIAVLGAHPRTHRAAHYVPAYLREQGYQIIPVNPRFAGEPQFGRATIARVTDLEEPVDMIDVFRPADALPVHVDEILAMKTRPKVVWFQLGIRNDEAAARLEAEGIIVVQDRCTLADHRRLF